MTDFKMHAINLIGGNIVLDSGLHIGAGNDEIHIGGIDNPVIKHPHSGHPYIPGSSIKGRMRSLLEWRAGVVGQTGGKPVQVRDLENLKGEQLAQVEAIVKLFGSSGDSSRDAAAERIGPTRLSFWDCAADAAWIALLEEWGLPLFEAKSENAINRITGVAQHPRRTERVPADAVFGFRLGFRILQDDDRDLLQSILAGLKLIQLDGLGGGGSRGSGKLHFTSLTMNGEDIQASFDSADPFGKAA